MVNVAVLIACYNRKELTLRCLAAISQQRGLESVEVDVFLVDDGSSDGTGDAVRAAYSQVRVLQGTGDLFWNRGMQFAFTEAVKGDYDYYLWLNDDTALDQDALRRLLDTYAEVAKDGNRAKIVAGGTRDPDTGQFTYGGVVRINRVLWKSFRRIAPTDKPVRCEATNGNCVLIPREVVRRVGVLDPIFQHRWGDHDYCFRACNAGCEVWLTAGYVGSCRWNLTDGTWRDPAVPLVKRYRLLWAPSGLQPKDYLVYVRRHRGLLWPYFWISPFIKILVTSLRYRMRVRRASPAIGAKRE